MPKSKILFFLNLNLKVWQRSIYVFDFGFVGITVICSTKNWSLEGIQVTLGVKI